MYLIVIAWFYVTVMMALAEAFSPQGTLLGGLITFALYGLMPMGIIVYILGTPERKRKLKAQRDAEQRAYDAAHPAAEPAPETLDLPDTSGHTASATEDDSISAVREKR